MIKELAHWVLQLIIGLFTLKPSRISYDFKNLYYYLRYGFAYWDVQDLDEYLTKRISKMIPFIRGKFVSSAKEYQELNELENLSNYIFSYDFEDLNYNKQQKLRNRFTNLLKKYYFKLWF